MTRAKSRDERRRKPAPTLVAPPPGYGHRLAQRATIPDAGGERTAFELAGDEPSLVCVEYWPEVRYRNYGYDHLVHLWNRCDVRAVCDVASDVNPNPVRVEIAPRDRIEVLTFRGSPAREFTPRVNCRVRLSD